MTSTEAYETTTCSYYSSGLCRSCALLAITPGKRIATKEATVREILHKAGVTPKVVEPITFPKQPWGSRSKVKLSVTGSIENPTLGIVRSDLSSQDLSECPLTPAPVQSALAGIREVIKEAKLAPYDIKERAGELKQIIITTNHNASSGMVRFVLRSSEAVSRIRKSVPKLMKGYPWIEVVSCNIQPLPAAILEGPEEIILTEKTSIDITYNSIPLSFSPQSFMQVTHEIAEALYARVAQHVTQGAFTDVLDLFCGVGGFSLSVARSVKTVRGVEFSASAVQSAHASAKRLSIDNASFFADDVERFLEGGSAGSPDLIIANPPRRGLSPSIVASLKRLAPKAIVYSSCNPETFARDVKGLSETYELDRLALFDMFPMTEHCEVLGFLRRAS
jgi:23S rRNA (uracil747-C5)-methyltransferase